MGIIHRVLLLIRRVVLRARPACIVAAPGTTMPGTAGQRIATSTTQVSATATWAFASSGHVSFWFFTFLHFARGMKALTPIGGDFYLKLS